ncbi:MAG TPA: glyoxylate/hydroxypyruvate reductase A [Steroidobacteraceae bacterium]
MSIVLIGDLSAAAYETWRGHLARHLPAGESLVLDGRCGDKAAVDVALAANPPWGELATYPNLRFVQSLWAGVDRLLGDPALPRNIPIARLIDPAMAQSMVEGAVAATLFVHRQLPAYLRQQHHRTWRQLPQPMASHRTVGVLGFGQMGQPVCGALAALGFRVHAWGQRPRTDTTIVYSWGDTGLQSMLAQAQILLNLLPLTPATTGILNLQLLAQLPEGAALINLGRGAHLVDDDLLDALGSRHLSHAVLDVFHQEPLPTNHPFWTHPRITVLPHVAATTDPASAAPIAVQNVVAFRAGRPLTGLVSRSSGY